MSVSNSTKLTGLLAKAGIAINGQQPWDIQVKDSRLFRRAMIEPSLGMGESYMDGWWQCDRLDEFYFKVFRYLKLEEIYKPSTLLFTVLKNALTNPYSFSQSTQVVKEHYNIGNDLYTAMLGSSMAYTCAYWREAHSLDEAQLAKYDLICRKLRLQPGEKVLELGCGFGGFAKFATEKYQVEMVSINISQEQLRYARQICQGVPIQFVECDYRDIKNYNPAGIKFDKAVSIGLCEHVGHKNYRNLMEIVRKNLHKEGLFLLHTIGKNITLNFTDPWIQKYIFPHGELPSITQINKASEGLMVAEDIHNIGADYDKTLMAWHQNFEKNWSALKGKYDERFYRMWRYYLLSCAGGFRARSMQLYQFLFSMEGELNGYISVR